MNAPVLEERLYAENSIATLNRHAFGGAGVYAVSMIGGPGSGKTSLIDATIDRLMPDVHVGVIACDVASPRDADRLSRHARNVIQVNTGQQGVSDATHVQNVLQRLDLDWIDLLFIENVGTLIGPVTSDLGQDVTVAMFSAAGGHDKADKHPELVRAADIVLLNKIDLIASARFDPAHFRDDVRRLHPGAKLYELSATQGQGIEPWIEWLKVRVTPYQQAASKWFG